MHVIALGEGERLSDEAPQPLAQRAIRALHVIGLSAPFAHRLVLLLRNYVLVALLSLAALPCRIT
jgi:hypothetical protein